MSRSKVSKPQAQPAPVRRLRARGERREGSPARPPAGLTDPKAEPKSAADQKTAQHAAALAGSHSPEVIEKIKELLRLHQEQGYLTYNDVNEALPDSLIGPEELDQIYVQLRNLDVEIFDQAEVDRVRQPEEEEEERSRLDVLDDPVRMYLTPDGPGALADPRPRKCRFPGASSKPKTRCEGFFTASVYGQGAHQSRREARFRSAERAI
jgi:RNA polymerase primary sigma factor